MTMQTRGPFVPRNLCFSYDCHILFKYCCKYSRANTLSATLTVLRRNRHVLHASNQPESKDASTKSKESNAELASGKPLPWQISTYYTKKSRRDTDASGVINQDPANLSAPVGWNSDTKLQLAVQAIANESGIKFETVYSQLETMTNVVPDLLATSGIKLADVVRLAVHGEHVAEKLLALKGTFPEADVSSMVVRCPQLLDMSLQELVQSTEQTRDMLAGATPSPAGVVQAVPQLASAAALQAVLQELQRLFGLGEGEVLKMLCKNPALADCCQSLSHQARGDRDPEYVNDMFGKTAEQ